MLAPRITRFGFRIRTRQGIVFDNVVLPGRDEADAERKVRQIYRDCEILGRFGVGRGQIGAAVIEMPRLRAVI